MPPESEFSNLFHQISKKSRGNIPQDYSQWPAEWTTIRYKSYPRFPKIVLDKTDPSINLAKALRERKSSRDFAQRSIGKAQLSTLLEYSCGKKQEGEPYRVHPSAGARYPLECYPIVFLSNPSLPAGLYHYNVDDHALDVLMPQNFKADQIDRFFTYPWAKNASMALVITAIFSRTTQKYGDRGYRNALIEAGHMGQNLYLVGVSLGLKCTAIAGTRDENIESFLDIDGVTESLVYALLFD